MDPTFFIRGVIFGFSIAAPVGPIGALCIKRTLAEGRIYGLVSGLGVASADMTYGFVAAFGLTAISDVLTAPTVSALIRVIGGLFLCYLGFKTIVTKPATVEQAAAVTRPGLLGGYLSAYALTIANPPTIILFAALFASLRGGATSGDYGSATVLVLGVFTGSASWWFLLSGGVSLLRARMSARWLQIINVVSGLVILVLGLVSVLSVF